MDCGHHEQKKPKVSRTKRAIWAFVAVVAASFLVEYYA